jgi:NADPH:quinone reductase-like Zn-dependent oxidoreductase
MRPDRNGLRLDIIADQEHIHNGNDRSMAVEDTAFDDRSTRSQSQGGSKMSADTKTGLQLRSLIKKSGELEISLASVPVPEPGPDEVVVRVEASPINPSDLGLLVGAADMSTAKASGTREAPVITAKVPEAAMPAMAGRLDESMPVGNEGAGVVVKTGSSDSAKALMGKTVAMIGGAMYAQYRCLKAAECLPLPAGITPAEGASCFVNPLTALGMTETMRREGHKALVHTAAASNLGQMLNKICLKDGIGLVNIVRSGEQADILRKIGAKHVVDSTVSTFMNDLTNALVETGATLAFDAIGGGKLAGQILTCMEIAANKTAKVYSRYGSSVHKQVYIYGGLDTRPTELNRGFGMAWGVGGWLLTTFLQKIGPDGAKLRQRVVAELKTTFASHYTQVVSLQEVLQLNHIAVYAKRATGEKYLINPNKGG